MRRVSCLLAVLLVWPACGGSQPVLQNPIAPSVTLPAPSNPGAAPTLPYTLTPSANAVIPGGQLSVSWTAPRGGARDWIGLFSVGAAACDHGWSEYTRGATSGTLALTAPTKPGEYEFRYYPDDGCVDTVRSRAVTVIDPALN